MEINNLVIRRATLDDKEAVFAINDNVYDGLDYLPAYYDKFMAATNVRAYVGEIGGTVVAFSIAFLVDDGQSVISRAGRVSEKYAGRRIYATLQHHILEHSEATENWFTAVDASNVVDTESFKRENELMSTRRMIRFDFNVDDSKMNQVSAEFKANIANSSTQDDLQKLMTSPKHAEYLFPDDIIIVAWVPFRLRPSNMPLMGFSEMSNMCSNVTENGENVNGLLSILTVYPTKNKRLAGMLDIYGNDVTSINIHVAQQLKFVKAHGAHTRVSLLVIFHEYIDKTVVVKHFNTFGIEKFDWKWPDSGQMVSKVLAYRKVINK